MSNQNKKSKKYGYVRVSTQTQADKGYGLDTQTEAIKEYCTNNNLELADIFIDAGKSGAIGDKDDINDRTELCALLDILQDGDSIIVMNTSRLWRDPAANVAILKRVRSSNSNIKSIEQPTYDVYNNDPNNFLINGMFELLDMWDRLSINSKLAKGRKTKASKGDKSCGKQAFGYKYNKNDKKTIIDKSKANIVKDIFNKRAEGSSFPEIVNYLNDNKINNSKNKEWNYSTVRKMINNDYYIGVVTHANQKYNGNHEPIIDKDTWNKVCEINELSGKHIYNKLGAV